TAGRRGAAAAVRRPQPGRTPRADILPARLRLCPARRSRVVGTVRPRRGYVCAPRDGAGSWERSARGAATSVPREAEQVAMARGSGLPAGAATSVPREAEQGRDGEGKRSAAGAATSVPREAEHRRSAARGITPAGAGGCRGQL